MLRTLKSTLFDVSFANPALFLVRCVWYSFVQFLIFNLVLLLCFSCSTNNLQLGFGFYSGLQQSQILPRQEI